MRNGQWRRQWGWLSGLWLLLVVSPGAAQPWRPDVRVLETLQAGQVNWTDNLVLSRERATSASRRTADAAISTAATQAARQRLLTALTEVRLDASRLLGAVVQESPALRQALEEAVADAEVYEMHYFPGGTVESAVQLPLRGRFMTLLLPANAVSSGGADEPSPAAVYTGVVIDARGLAIQSALLPRIVDESGQTLYAPEVVDPVLAAQRGYIAYAHAFDRTPTQERIGTNPLVLRAHRISGEARVDLVLRSTDAAQLRDYPTTQRLLQRCQVLIVR